MEIRRKLVVSMLLLVAVLVVCSMGIYAEDWDLDYVDYDYLNENSLESEIEYYFIGDEDIPEGEYYEVTNSDTISVLLNGELIDFTDAEGNVVNPQIINDRTMVPMRKIFEVFGAEVEWDGETQSILATKDDLQINLQIGSSEAIVVDGDNLSIIELDSAPVIVDSRTLVPVRFIAESLQMNVDWDSETRTVIITDLEENAEYYEYYLDEEADEDLSEINYYWIDGDQ